MLLKGALKSKKEIERDKKHSKIDYKGPWHLKYTITTKSVTNFYTNKQI
jgi:hypothetical protein